MSANIDTQLLVSSALVSITLNPTSFANGVSSTASSLRNGISGSLLEPTSSPLQYKAQAEGLRLPPRVQFRPKTPGLVPTL